MNTIKLFVLFALITLASCNVGHKAEATPDQAKAESAKPPRNLAVEYVLSEDKDAKCTVYHQHEGPKLTDSAKCELSDKHRVFVRVDTDATKVDRIDPPTAEEIRAAQAQQAQAEPAKKGAKK